MNKMDAVSAGGMADFELLSLYKTDNNLEALALLFSRYQTLILSRIRRFGFSTADTEDLLQECMIGLYGAINVFEPQKSSFQTFSRLCIDRMLISVLRKKNKASAIPENELIEYEDESDVLSNINNDPQLILERLDNFEELVQKVRSVLSKLEFSVLVRVFNGMSYREISEDLGIPQKSVNNAVQRIRKKFSKF